MSLKRRIARARVAQRRRQIARENSEIHRLNLERNKLVNITQRREALSAAQESHAQAVAERQKAEDKYYGYKPKRKISLVRGTRSTLNSIGRTYQGLGKAWREFEKFMH